MNHTDEIVIDDDHMDRALKVENVSSKKGQSNGLDPKKKDIEKKKDRLSASSLFMIQNKNDLIEKEADHSYLDFNNIIEVKKVGIKGTTKMVGGEIDSKIEEKIGKNRCFFTSLFGHAFRSSKLMLFGRPRN